MNYFLTDLGKSMRQDEKRFCMSELMKRKIANFRCNTFGTKIREFLCSEV